MSEAPVIRTLIVDDEPLARERVRTLLDAEAGFEVIDECGDGAAAVTAIGERRPDLVFLDIQMPEMNGFEVLAALPPEVLPRVIFVTAYDKYALNAFEVHAVDYLLKPFDRARFSTAIERIRVEIERDRTAGAASGVRALLGEVRTLGTRDRLVVRSGGGVLFLPFNELDRVETAGNYVKLHANGASHLVRETMAALETRLDASRFLRISRSTIVSIDRVRAIRPAAHGDYTVLLHDGTTSRLSRRYRESVAARLGRLS